MTQLAINFHPRAPQIEAAAAHADDAVKGWSDLAFLFLKRYARSHERVFSEDVVKAAKEWGLIQPPTDRAWGWPFIRAQREGAIVDDGLTRKRANGNKAADYRSLLCK